MIDDKGIIKLVDFGFVRVFGIFIRVYIYEVVIFWYRFLEVLLGLVCYLILVDIWSIGIIFVELVIKKLFFYGDLEID